MVHYECKFCIGGGTGGEEEYLGKTDSADKCAERVNNTRPTANGATWGPNNKKCYAEYAQTKKNNKQKWRNCMFEPIKGQLF